MTDAPEQRLLRAANASLACVGLYVGAFGPALGELAADLDVSLDTAGLTLTAAAAGAVTAAGTVALWLHHRNQRLVVAAGIALLSAGLAGWALAPSWPLFLLMSVLAGAGGGFADAGSHGLAAASTRSDIAVSNLNRAFAAGAVAGPLWAGSILQAGGARWLVFAGLAVATAAVIALIARAPDPRPSLPPAHEQLVHLPARIPLVAVIMSALLFLYVGAEIGLGAWITSATERAADATVLAGALVTSGYWGALWAGRTASGWALHRGWRSERILVASLVGAAAGSIVLAIGGEQIAAGAVGAAIAGFCFGPIWPAAVALGTRSAPKNTAALMVTLGNAGGIMLPWLQGRVLVDSGPRAGMALSAALCAGMLALAAASLAFSRKQSSRVPAL